MFVWLPLASRRTLAVSVVETPKCSPGLALQIKGMKDRLEFWCTDVRSMEMLVEHQAHDILT